MSPSEKRAMLGPVFERKTSPASLPQSSSKFSGTPGSGFPAAQHRSKSAFSRAREKEAKGSTGATRLNGVPSVVVTPTQAPRPPPPVLDTKPIPTDTNALRRQISQENERKVAEMTEEEIEKEKQDILEQLGSGTGELLRRIREARQRKLGQEALEKSIEDKVDDVPRQTTEHRVFHPKPTRGVLRVKSLDNLGKTAPSAVSPARSSTRPSSRASRKLRFAEVTPDDVHVYESAPVSPKRTVFALPPPPDTKDDSIVSLGTYQVGPVPRKRPHPTDSPTDDASVDQPTTDGTEPEEGTPEYIRRRYFPDIAANDPSLAWIESASSETDHSAPRFDLNGAPIPASLSATLPSHLGLHHHAEGTRAGYTIEDIFLLSRSTVPAQRVSMLGILAKIARRLGQQVRQPNLPDKIAEFSGKEGELRKRILAAGLAATDQIGSLGARAVEVVWECLVEWDRATSDVEGVELMLAPDVVSSLQLDYFLPQLLAVLHRLAQESNELAEAIVNTSRLIPAILQTFVLTPIPPREDSPLPNPFAIQLLITLASASRANASALLDPADALLRFVTLLPPSSPFGSSLAVSLLTNTLRFYTTLASYGLYCHVATTASQYFSTLGTYVLSTQTHGHSETQEPKLALSSSPSSSAQLRVAWASLIEAWIVCATDPHATSPPHEILWSQVSGWEWAMEVRKLRKGLGMGELEWGVSLEAIQKALGGPLPAIEEEAQSGLRAIASRAGVISSALRLWLACLSPPSDGTSLSTPPFPLPFSDLSALCAILVRHHIWFFPSTSGTHLQVHLRPLTSLLVRFHRVSRHIPGTTPHLWLAQGLVFLSRLLPGDEAHALAMLDTLSLVTPQFIGVQPLQLPESITMDILKPFFEHTVHPDTDVYIAPLHPTPESVMRSSTLRLPGSSTTGGAGEDAQKTKAGFPLPRDWLTSPLTHLLRSGTSSVFRALPASWAASEVDVVRATLVLLYAARRVLVDHDLGEFVLGPAEVVFACMRVCMLEHGVVGGNVSAGNGSIDMDEVFRDEVVERLMKWLLAPYTPHAASSSDSSSTITSPSPPVSPSEAAPLPKLTPQTFLELASLPYLQQTATPFYQFYTDLVALYSAVSFRHTVFGVLLLPPLAMRYAGDYRRLLWCESGDGGGGGRWHGSIVCTGLGWEGWDGNVREPDVREYLYPIERDGRLLGGYVQSLTARPSAEQAQGFLRLVAVHHVACAIWEDLKTQAPARDASAIRAGEVEVGAKLLRMVLGRGDGSASTGGVRVAPACYDGGRDRDSGTDGRGGEVLSGWKAARLAFVRRALGDEPAERVKGVFGQH
ncbi:hypothetical protein BU15DRAFT_67919 [Melanogaster broomeanus]|nr:hypothetical protein BU15DRAFT_67919 [Melanogaster broomeanus]